MCSQVRLAAGGLQKLRIGVWKLFGEHGTRVEWIKSTRGCHEGRTKLGVQLLDDPVRTHLSTVCHAKRHDDQTHSGRPKTPGTVERSGGPRPPTRTETPSLTTRTSHGVVE